MSITKIQADKNGREYILFRTDVYFIGYPLAAEIDGKEHADRNLIFQDYHCLSLTALVRLKTNKRVRKIIKQENKRARRWNKKIKLYLTCQTTQKKQSS